MLPSSLSNVALVGRVQELVEASNEVTGALVEHLAEIEARRLHLELGYASLFQFCTEQLQLSESSAYKRITAARLLRRHAALLPYLVAGKVHLSALMVLAPHLTEANHVELLEAAVHKSKRDIEKLIAERYPRPDVKTQLRKLPAVGTSASAAAELATPSPTEPGAGVTSVFAGPQASPSPQAVAAGHEPTAALPRTLQAQLSPLASTRYRLQLTASQSLYNKLRLAQDLLRHQVPDGDLATVVERALDLLIDKTLRRKFGAAGRDSLEAPTPTPPVPQGRPADAQPAMTGAATTSRSRYIPKAVRREVLARDGLQCAYVGDNGRRCTARAALELDHVVPYARGGLNTVSGLRILCAAHNRYEAERAFGRQLIEARIADSNHHHRQQLAPGRVDADTFTLTTS